MMSISMLNSEALVRYLEKMASKHGGVCGLGALPMAAKHRGPSVVGFPASISVKSAVFMFLV